MVSMTTSQFHDVSHRLRRLPPSPPSTLISQVTAQLVRGETHKRFWTAQGYTCMVVELDTCHIPSQDAFVSNLVCVVKMTARQRGAKFFRS